VLLSGQGLRLEQLKGLLGCQETGRISSWGWLGMLEGVQWCGAHVAHCLGWGICAVASYCSLLVRDMFPCGWATATWVSHCGGTTRSHSMPELRTRPLPSWGQLPREEALLLCSLAESPGVI
jgi:hypothetical protein